MITEAKRNPTRDKKPPRYLHSEETELDPSVLARNSHHRESRLGCSEINATAKMLVKFINSCSNKLKDSYAEKTAERLRQKALASKEIEAKKDTSMRPTEKKLRAGDVSASKEETKKLLAKGLIENMTAASTSSREASMRMNNALVEQQMQFDKNVLPYHKAIVETIRGGFPILNGCTSESMIKLGLSRALLEQNPASNLRFVENKEKKRSQQGPDLKLFKRQSYHIAIAYHIHLRNVRSVNVSQEVDPTYHSRKLKESLIGKERKDNKKSQ